VVCSARCNVGAQDCPGGFQCTDAANLAPDVAVPLFDGYCEAAGPM
jgi:hypothetical protein